MGATPPFDRLGFGHASHPVPPGTRWPGYYYRGDYMKLDDQNWHCFTRSRFDRQSGKWQMEKAPVYHIID